MILKKAYFNKIAIIALLCCKVVASPGQNSHNHQKENTAFLHAHAYLSSGDQIANSVLMVKDSLIDVIGDARLVRLNLQNADTFMLSNRYIHPPAHYKKHLKKLAASDLDKEKFKRHINYDELKLDQPAVFWVSSCKNPKKCEPEKFFWMNRWIYLKGNKKVKK